MSQIFGSLRPDATYGEQKVMDLLRTLPDDYLVWPELNVGEQYPDFVVFHPQQGLAVIEVKDWVEVVEASSETFTVRTRAGDMRNERNPLLGARSKAIAIANRLEQRARLLHASGPHMGRLKVPWSYAVVLTNLTRMFVYQLGDVAEPRYLICQDDLFLDVFAERLAGLDFPFGVDLTAAEIDEVRAGLDPVLRVVRPGDGAELGIADRQQEQIAKEGLHAAPGPALEDELTPEGRRIATEIGVRLVRGVAGSGKTLVLAMRARYLADLHPDWRILVVTFNRLLTQDLADRLADYRERITVTTFHMLCSAWMKEIEIWQNGPVNDSQGRIANLLRSTDTNGDALPWDAAFLAAEFAWIKEMGIRDEAHYLEVPRLGRGTRLTKKERTQVYALFERYEEKLSSQRRYDWQDVPLMALDALMDGDVVLPAYHAILVDEAQDFAPTWFDVLRLILHPETRLMFLAADSTQRIYRRFTWKSMGLNVVGRTRILPKSYRSTYQIMQAASALIQGNPDLLAEMRDEEEEHLVPELDPGWMRHGPPPVLRQFGDRYNEVQFIAATVNQLLAQGYAPGDIVVLHRKQKLVERYRSELRQAGISAVKLPHEITNARESLQFATMHSAKGLEYRAVFIVQAQMLFDQPDQPIRFDERPRFLADELRLLYVAMTRARELLYITHQNRLPDPINALQHHLTSLGERAA